jgi:hypothetical protein
LWLISGYFGLFVSKTHMKKLAALMALAVCAMFLTTCKKGKDDPAFSLLTRKARLTGEWQLTRGNASITYPDPDLDLIFNEYYVFDGSSVSLNMTETGQPPIIYTGKYGVALSIKKDGTFTLTETLVSNMFYASGTWNFTSGVGKAKNKDGVLFKITNLTSGKSNTHLFNQADMEFSYKIIELRNKKIVLEGDVDLYRYPAGKDYASYSSHYEFKNTM